MSTTIADAIRNDHSILRKMLQEIKKERDAMSPGLDEAFMRLRALSDIHMKSEEDLFYTVLKERSSSRAEALEALEEHHILRILEQEMVKLDKNDEIWKAKFGLYAEISNHHFDEEEEKLFQEVNQEISQEFQEELGQLFEQRKKLAKIPDLTAV